MCKPCRTPTEASRRSVRVCPAQARKDASRVVAIAARGGEQQLVEFAVVLEDVAEDVVGCCRKVHVGVGCGEPVGLLAGEVPVAKEDCRNSLAVRCARRCEHEEQPAGFLAPGGAGGGTHPTCRIGVAARCNSRTTAQPRKNFVEADVVESLLVCAAYADRYATSAAAHGELVDREERPEPLEVPREHGEVAFAASGFLHRDKVVSGAEALERCVLVTPPRVVGV